MKHGALTCTGIFLLCQLSILHAQNREGELSMGDTISTKIGQAEKHRYKIRLEKDRFVFLRLVQNGVDLKITTYGPKTEKLSDYDSPNGKFGPELFSLTSSIGGEYIIEVYPLDEKQPRGSYELSIVANQPKAVSPNEMVDELCTPWNNSDTPGVAVAIVKDGAIVHKKGYGMANLEYDVPIDPSTVFHIASISKQFTVFSVLLLEQEGKLNLDDDIRKYIPEVPDFGKPITLRHLASHTSGLRDQWNLLAMAGWRLDDVITREHILKLVSKQKALNFNPGDEFLYCNTGFTLLAEVVSRVSGKSFATFTKARIFSPLQMHSTLFYDDHEKIVKNRAYSYYWEGNEYRKNVLSYANVGATSLFTTVEDLSLWVLNFADPEVGSPSIIQKMNTPAVLNNGKPFGGALGQFVGKYKGLRQIQHGGADAGYRTYLARFPDQDFAVIVFSNDGGFNAGQMAYNIADIYLNGQLQQEPEKPEPPDRAVTIDQETLNSYVGDYELQPGFVISISETNGQLFAQGTGQPRLPLNPVSQTTFSASGVEAIITFLPNSNGRVELMQLAQGGQVMDARRVQPFDKASVNLVDYEGHFYSEELSTGYHFKILNNQLTAQHSRLSDITLSPVKEDVFSGDVWFFGQIEFIRVADKRILGCKVSSGRVRDLWFQKM